MTSCDIIFYNMTVYYMRVDDMILHDMTVDLYDNT